jgi:hypothetical protein
MLFPEDGFVVDVLCSVLGSLEAILNTTWIFESVHTFESPVLKNRN